MPRADLNLTSLPSDFESLVRIHPPAAIHDAVAYGNAMDVVNLLTSQPNPTEGQLKYLDTLTILIERYEDETEGVEPQGVGAVTVLRYLMEDRGLVAADLGQLLGDPNLGAEILNGDRSLTTAHIKILASHFKISASLLLD